MTTKFSNWLSNKDKKSKKPAGCMTGIIGLFDGQFLLSRRQLNGQDHKTNPSGHAPISFCKQGVESAGEFCNLGQNLSRSYQEDSGSSMESSSRTSFSSSSTSFSSLKHRLPQEKPRCSEQSFSSGRSPKNSSRPRSTDINQSPGLRDITKESLSKDPKSVSIKEKAKEEVKRNKVLKPVDSPRPIDLSQMKDLEESLRILIKLRELPRNFHGEGGSPRFSYDGREILQTSTDIKHAITQKEHRRLSLDSMEDSLRFDYNSKVNSLMNELEKKTNLRVSEASNLHQDLKSNENHQSIVAKLMGLESINSARNSSVKGYEPGNTQKKQESKHGKLLQSTSNSPKSRSSISPHMKSDSSSRLVVEETKQKMTLEYVEGNMKQKIESGYNVIEKTLQKLELRHNSKEIRDLRRAILEIKKNGDWNFRLAKSLSPSSKSGKSSISERALNCPIVVMRPESKSAGISSSKCAKLEGPSRLRKNKTSESSDRKKESLSADGGQTPTGKTAKNLSSLSKETSRRVGDNSVSPRLQKTKPDQERKSCTMIPTFDLQKTQRQPGNRQQSVSVSPSGRIRQKSSKAQDNEGKSHLFHQTKRNTATNAASASKHKQHQMIPRKALSAEELEKTAPQLSSPNSVLDASLYQDDLPLSPLSVSSISNAEDENLHSDHNLKVMHLPQSLPSTLSFDTDSQKPESMDTKVHKFIFPGTTTDEPTLTNEITLILDSNDPINKYVAEVLLASSLLTKDSLMPAKLEQIKPIEPFKAVEKNNPEMLHKQLVYDVVNEILARKIEAFNCDYQHDHLLESKRLSAQLLFKELCLEVKYLQSSRNGSLQDKDSVFTKDLLRGSNAWNSFESEVPVVVLEIEMFIFADLINEIVSNMIAAVLETKQRHRRMLFV